MLELFESALFGLLQHTRVLDSRKTGASAAFPWDSAKPEEEARSLNAAFLVALCGSRHRLEPQARQMLEKASHDASWKEIARFFLDGLGRVRNEIRNRCAQEADFAQSLKDLDDALAEPSAGRDPLGIAERAWAVFFPEAVGIRDHREDRIRSLREARRICITSPNPFPVVHPVREVMFTANVLLTIPPDGELPCAGTLSNGLMRRLEPVLQEPQAYWYDHPVQIGVAPENNEILYGLKGLDEALAFEKARGTLSADERAVCLLSVSVTHQGLQTLAREYIQEEIQRVGGFRHLHVFAFTEADTQRLAEEVLSPAAARYLGAPHPASAFPEVFGVDGDYGRHYSFLKAVAPLWHVLIDPSIRATFKIDLDQVFPQEALVAETGSSALELLKTPLWGALGKDDQGRPVELGLIAGALVNEEDIHEGLFTPDVRFPGRLPSPEELVFFSALPQALSTQTEMMTQYRSSDLDGRTSCIQRIHVTGGTTGALVKTLRRHRPFTPSFVGRAEDQAFIMASLSVWPPWPAYLHQPGLIMRHDKASFAAEAVHASRIPKIIGDDLRILIFSAYARALMDPPDPMKRILDPFTGGFASHIPQTVVHLRSALRAESFFRGGNSKEGLRIVREGTNRISKTLDFVEGDPSDLKKTYLRERRGWDTYYDVLSALEHQLNQGESSAMKLRGLARRIVRECALI
jgi:hypothetical protein